MSVIDASAADVWTGTTHTLDVATVHLWLGSTIEGQFYDGIAYESCNFEYVGYTSGSSVFGASISDPNSYLGYDKSYDFLIYRAAIQPSNSNQATFTVKLNPSNIYLGDLHHFAISAGISCSNNSGSANTGVGWENNFWEIQKDNTAVQVDCLPRYSNNNNSWGALGLTTPTGIDNQSVNLWYRPVVLFYNSQEEFKIQCQELTFSYVYSDYASGGVYFYITTPTISDDFKVLNPDGSEPETDDGLLKTIKNKVIEIFDTLTSLASHISNAILDGLKALFIPTSEDIEDFVDDLDDLLSRIFGISYTLESQLHTEFTNLFNGTSATGSIRFPGVSYNGQTIIAAQDVPLKPAGFDGLFEALATAIDLVCTIAFYNMLKHRFEKAVLENTG